MKKNENAKAMNQITELVFLLDRSGSMGGLESDTIGGFNAMIEKQKKTEAGQAYVTTVLFDDRQETLHDRLALSDVPVMTGEDYTVRGCTALLDAVGDTIEHIRSIHRYARKEDVPAHTMFVITTDGMENASRRYDYREIKRLISRQKEAGWEFLFIGANIDAAEVAEQVGISRDRAANYRADSQGTARLFRTLAKNVTAMRCEAAIAPDWADGLNSDE